MYRHFKLIYFTDPTAINLAVCRKFNVQNRQAFVLYILLEKFRKAMARMGIDIMYNIVIIYLFMVERAVQSPQDRAPFVIVIKNGAQHIHDDSSFVVHV